MTKHPAIKKYEGITGDELPVKGSLSMREISKEQYISLDLVDKEYHSPDWGNAINLPCESNKTTDGKHVEIYCSFGWSYRYFIEQ